jgi:DNA-binding CsgD family transcriptional regulator
MDSLSAHVAILDKSGTIIETNRAWQNFARKNGMNGPFDCIGINYFTICESVTDGDTEKPGLIANGLRNVLTGKRKDFFTQYPCHSKDKKRWYALRIVPFRDISIKRVIMTHEEITPIMLVQEKLEIKEAELLRQRERLEETNTALRVLLRQRDEDRARTEDTFVQNTAQLVQPYLDRLLQGSLAEKQRTLAEIIDTNLKDLVSPFIRRLNSLTFLLTPQELTVADMVRHGKTSKEMAEIMNLSVSGVDFHRRRLRNKLGLTNSPRNLRTHLLSLTDTKQKTT